jgi:N-acetylglutamate synthase-like GNAT family acetyltransferase
MSIRASSGDPMTELNFRHATAQDIPAVVDLVQSAYRGDRSRSGWTTEADLIEGQRIDAPMLLDVLERPRTIVLLAETDQLTGCCELSAEHGSDIAYFGMFAVRPELQGTGLGDRILRKAEQTAIDLWGASAMRLVTIHLRNDVIAWYARRGFTPTGATHRFPYGDERYGRPNRDDLTFAEFEKVLDGGTC